MNEDHFHGINVPLSALTSKNSSGIGEYLDLYPLIDWCKEIGFHIIQLLPIKDSGYDPSPYNAITSNCLHPIYLSLHALEGIKDVPLFVSRLQEMKKYNAYQRIQYEAVLNEKNDFLKLYYSHFLFRIIKDKGFIQFKDDYPHIKIYSLFKILREKYHLASFEKWPYEVKDPSATTVCNLLESYAEDIEFHSYVQYLCFCQMKSVKAYATQNNIRLMGDIPILISKDSADVWHDRHLFDLSLVAGAPPDALNQEGQYWGFPLYNWSAIEAEHYQFWKIRLSFSENFYDIFRIDHIVGFYRIWGITPGDLATKGRFVPEEEEMWLPHGHKILSKLLSFTSMHPIGEDLGTIPKQIYQSLFSLGIDRTIMVRWEKDYEKTGNFIPFKDYYKGSVTTLSTHDSETLSEWAMHEKEEFKLYCENTHIPFDPTLPYPLRLAILKQAHHTNSHFHINLLQEYLALFEELVYPHMGDERINVPGKILPTNWTYRFRPSIEEILEHEGLKKAMREIQESL